MNERYLAARCRHLHGDPYWSEDEAAAHRGKRDLIGRTWAKSHGMGRDERRLLRRYERSLAGQRERDLEAFRACPTCSGL